MKGVPMNVEATRLLGEAQATAIASLHGLDASQQNLKLLADAVYSTVMRQALAGKWSSLGVKAPEQLAGLVVKASFGNTLVGEPPIKILYEFAKTDLQTLVVSSVRVS